MTHASAPGGEGSPILAFNRTPIASAVAFGSLLLNVEQIVPGVEPTTNSNEDPLAFTTLLARTASNPTGTLKIAVCMLYPSAGTRRYGTVSGGTSADNGCCIGGAFVGSMPHNISTTQQIC